MLKAVVYYCMPERDFHEPSWSSGKKGCLLCYHDKKMPFYVESHSTNTFTVDADIFYSCNALFSKILTFVKVVQPLWTCHTFLLPGFACSFPLSGYAFVYATWRCLRNLMKIFNAVKPSDRTVQNQPIPADFFKGVLHTLWKNTIFHLLQVATCFWKNLLMW